MDDLISRQNAINTALEFFVEFLGGAFHEDDQKILMKRMNELPSAEPERKKGEWIDYTENGYVECPFCHSATNCDGNKDELHYCYSCGADMRG